MKVIHYTYVSKYARKHYAFEYNTLNLVHSGPKQYLKFTTAKVILLCQSEVKIMSVQLLKTEWGF